MGMRPFATGRQLGLQTCGAIPRPPAAGLQSCWAGGGERLLIVDCGLLIEVPNQQSTISNQQSAINNQQSTINNYLE
jgi:hypothetical protein